MFSVLIPTFYAGSVHGLWVGIGVFLVMAVLVIALNFSYMALLTNEKWEKEINAKEPLGRLVTYRTILATIACVIIAISSAETCHINSEGNPECQSPWAGESP